MNPNVIIDAIVLLNRKNITSNIHDAKMVMAAIFLERGDFVKGIIFGMSFKPILYEIKKSQNRIIQSPFVIKYF